jgi:4-amino-4-deoxy-L-arabinose transferase-like glycosyltransferase
MNSMPAHASFLSALLGRFARGEAALVRVGGALDSLETRSADAARACLAFTAVMICAATLMLYRLGAAEVCSSNEAVEGLAVQQMIEEGHVLFPRLNGTDQMYKPPFFHWTATALAYLLGMHDVTELMLRLPSVLYGLGGVLLTMVFVRGWLGLPSAVLAGLVLLGSYQYVDQARFGRVDMTLTFYETLALFSFLWWLSTRPGPGDGTRAPAFSARRRTAAHYAFALALALGVLAKGPVGMILPLTAACVFLAIERRTEDLRALCLPGPVLVFVTVASSWYVMAYLAQHVDVLQRQLVSENISRFFGGMRTMPPWYYVTPLLLNSAPFSLIVPIAVMQALRSRTAGEREDSRGTAPADAARARLLAIFWVLTVLFFSIAAYKRRAYLLPLWPPAAVLLVWWIRVHPVDATRRLMEGVAVASSLALMTFNLLYVPHAEQASCRGAQYRRAVSAIKRVVSPGAALYSYGFVGESAPLLFYLDRTVPVLAGALADAPRGYLLVPEGAWAEHRVCGSLRPILTVSVERQRLVLVESTRPAPTGDVEPDPPGRAPGRGE